MSLTIELLGPPSVCVGGRAVGSPPDRKTWGLLAYLLLTDRPPTRQRLAELLFPDTQDPLAAVRWTLVQLRRLLGSDVVLGGDPVEVRLPAGTSVDLHLVLGGRWREAVQVGSIGHELLEGLVISSAPGFELWLAGERLRFRSAAAAVLHEAALALLARDVDRAVALAERLVRLDPYDENHHVVLVRALAMAGRPEEARARQRACITLFERELGTAPTGALRDALTVRGATSTSGATRASIRAQMEAGGAAVNAGSWSNGIDLFRHAVDGARATGDAALLSRCLVALGSALVHAARGHDVEGAASLHEGGSLAEQVGDAATAATAWRELAWVEFLRARYERSRRWLARATIAAAGDPVEVAWIATTSGAAQTDVGEYAAAERDLRTAVEVADREQLATVGALAQSFLGRLMLLRGDLGEAVDTLAASVDRARRAGWTSLIPWPQALLAEAELRRGQTEHAADLFEHAYTMGRELGDPCWESMGARGLGLVAVQRGDLDLALRMLGDAPKICRRLPDAYLWIEAYGLEALCALAVDRGLPSAGRWLDELEQLAGRAGFRELVARALAHRARLGQPGAAEAAVAAADGIDNPALHHALAELVPS